MKPCLIQGIIYLLIAKLYAGSRLFFKSRLSLFYGLFSGLTFETAPFAISHVLSSSRKAISSALSGAFEALTFPGSLAGLVELTTAKIFISEPNT